MGIRNLAKKAVNYVQKHPVRSGAGAGYLAMGPVGAAYGAGAGLAYKKGAHVLAGKLAKKAGKFVMNASRGPIHIKKNRVFANLPDSRRKISAAGRSKRVPLRITPKHH